MRVQKRRRNEAKTDYSKRIKLLKGGKPRIVLRKTNKYLISQYVASFEAQDKVLFGVNSKDLLKYGWPEKFGGSFKSTPAAYLIGLLTAKRVIDEKLENPIIDFGMARTINKSKVYAFLRGVIDGGIKINCKKEAFPSEERIKGKFLKEDFSKNFEEIKSKIMKK